MSSNDTSRLIEAKKNVKNSIVITGIYVVTVASYNLVRDPSFVENNVIMNTIDMCFTDSLGLTLGTLFPVTMVISSVLDYRKVKKESVKTISKKNN